MYMYSKVKSECPLCKSYDSKLLYEINSYEVTRYLKSESSLDFKKIKKIIEDLWGKSVCKKFYCNSCKLIYVKPFVAGNQEFYSKMYKSDAQYPDERLEYDLTIKAILDNNLEGDETLLEIGAGKGVFLDGVSFIKDKNIYANEISLSAIKSLERKGFKNYVDLYSEEIKERFDFICSFAVLEHLDNLDGLFKRLSKLLKKDGHLFISTHETSKVLFFEGNNAGLDLPPTHISCWNKKSFYKVCELYGYDYVEDKYIYLSLLRKMLNFGLGRFELRKMKRYSIEDNINSIKSKKKRKFFIYCYLLTLSPYIFYKTVGRKIISRQWVHLKKTKSRIDNK